MANKTRRIVTGNDADGKAVVQHDTAAPAFLPTNRPGVEVTNLWLTTEAPAKLTKTINYAIVLSGECHMALDDSDVLVTGGDVIIQRGTKQTWSNHSGHPCQMAFILIDGTGDGTVPNP